MTSGLAKNFPSALAGAVGAMIGYGITQWVHTRVQAHDASPDKVPPPGMSIVPLASASRPRAWTAAAEFLAAEQGEEYVKDVIETELGRVLQFYAKLGRRAATGDGDDDDDDDGDDGDDGGDDDGDGDDGDDDDGDDGEDGDGDEYGDGDGDDDNDNDDDNGDDDGDDDDDDDDDEDDDDEDDDDDENDKKISSKVTKSLMKQIKQLNAASVAQGNALESIRAAIAAGSVHAAAGSVHAAAGSVHAAAGSVVDSEPEDEDDGDDDDDDVEAMEHIAAVVSSHHETLAQMTAMIESLRARIDSVSDLTMPQDNADKNGN